MLGISSLVTTFLVLFTPEVRDLGDDCVIATKDIQSVTLRKDLGLVLRLKTGQVHPICPMRVTDAQARLDCENYLKLIMEAREHQRKLTLTYREHYDCRESFGGESYVAEILAMSVD